MYLLKKNVSSIKIVVMTLISVILLLFTFQVHALESTNWEKEVIIYPQSQQLVPAGTIEIKWDNTLLNDVDSYEVYLDGYLQHTLSGQTKSCEIYTTQVSVHHVKIIALFADGKKLSSQERTFYVSKKGLAYQQVDDVQNTMSSWYYNWKTVPSSLESSLEYVPMIWGCSNDEQSILTNLKNKGYQTVLGYNEPEGSLAGQSHVSVNDAVSHLENFKNSGLRIGSPAVEHVSDILKENSWFQQYMNQIDSNDLDFIAVHEYFYSVCHCSDKDNTKKVAKNFLTHLQKVYNLYHKPIWITELGVANWDINWQHYSYQSQVGKEEVYEFMKYVIDGVDGIKGLNDLDFVERYAWFPFDTQSRSAGASSLFVTESDYQKSPSLQRGELNDLGKLYRSLGNPEGYQPQFHLKHALIKIDSMEYTGQAVTPNIRVYYEEQLLKENRDYHLHFDNHTDVGKSQVIIEGIGNYTGKIEKSFSILPKNISNLSYSSIPNQKYTGTKIEVDIVIKDGEKVLKRNIDYSLYYSQNINLGKAEIKIIGKGNYTGTVRRNFHIVPNIILKKSQFVYKGKSLLLNASFNPKNLDEKLTWSSSYPNIASVDSQGRVTAHSVGQTIIKVQTESGANASCQITVPYTITYYLNGGKNNKSHLNAYYNQKIILKSPTKKGYIFKGWYSDRYFKKRIYSFNSGNKVVYAKWSKVAVKKAGAPKLSNLKGKKLKIAYSVSGAKGYQIQYATNKKLSKAVKHLSTSKSVIYKVKKGKTYYVRVRGYKFDSTGSKIYGSWSLIKSIIIKK